MCKFYNDGSCSHDSYLGAYRHFSSSFSNSMNTDNDFINSFQKVQAGRFVDNHTFDILNIVVHSQ